MIEFYLSLPFMIIALSCTDTRRIRAGNQQPAVQTDISHCSLAYLIPSTMSWFLPVTN